MFRVLWVESNKNPNPNWLKLWAGNYWPASLLRGSMSLPQVSWASGFPLGRRAWLPGLSTVCSQGPLLTPGARSALQNHLNNPELLADWLPSKQSLWGRRREDTRNPPPTPHSPSWGLPGLVPSTGWFPFGPKQQTPRWPQC